MEEALDMVSMNTGLHDSSDHSLSGFESVGLSTNKGFEERVSKS